MIARLKLKTVVDAEDAYEAQQLYNVILQQLQQVVIVVTNPSDEADNNTLHDKNNFNDIYENTFDSESGSHISHSSHSSDNPTEESSIHQRPRNAGRINRIRPHSDIWVCEDCSVKGDRWLLLDHDCRGYTQGDSV